MFAHYWEVCVARLQVAKMFCPCVVLEVPESLQDVRTFGWTCLRCIFFPSPDSDKAQRKLRHCRMMLSEFPAHPEK